MKKITIGMMIMAFAALNANAGLEITVHGKLIQKNDGSIRCRGSKGTCVKGTLGGTIFLKPGNPDLPATANPEAGSVEKEVMELEIYTGSGVEHKMATDVRVTGNPVGAGEKLVQYREVNF